jgi:spermidine synthase
MMRHGVVSSVAELDPAVYSYARRYFGLPQPSGSIYLEDARAVFKRRVAKFDYIVHDVFTGGSVPASLFTQETWTEVKGNLKLNGVLAVVRSSVAVPTSSHSFALERTLLDYCAHKPPKRSLPPYLTLSRHAEPLTKVRVEASTRMPSSFAPWPNL